MTQTNQEPLHYFIISDSIGDTALKVARAALAQFPSVNAVCHKYHFVENNQQLQAILEEANKCDGLIFMTIADDPKAKLVEEYCIETGLICYNLIQPYTLEIQRRTGLNPSAETGAQYVLSDEYFKRVKAMEFCITYDDGKDPKGFIEAEIVLLGISRTGKTPLSMYLANLGYKVANLPLVPEIEPPELLYTIDRKKIVGLTNLPKVVNIHRMTRMREYGMSETSRYASIERVEQELKYADEIYAQLKCPVLNVANNSVEESASMIVDMLRLPSRT
ncbi:pyruvate, water dikinase regulatory protein [Vaginisenegalia massiliensis]|uniref:pyruvate, water dikinase regulatory protein n=1 Tax=Vaginisenegalia massiliensis TaxID=2058294 RepID=UPI000F547D85|nr:pyruvate, water dikinase regulatory protein [Vaginisenegalia massiliensis]